MRGTLFFVLALTGPTAAAMPPGEPAQAFDAEARRLSGTLVQLWPRWSPDLGPAAGEAPAFLMPASGLGAEELAVAQRIALAFQGWADRAWPAPAGPVQQPSAALAPDEARLLIEALEAPKKRIARDVGVRLLAARRARLATVPQLAAVLYRRECREGLAVYTAYQALLAGRHAGYSPAAEMRAAFPDFRYEGAPALREELIRTLRAAALGTAGPPEASGFGLALLLDKTVPGWRKKLGEGPVDLASLTAAAGP